MAGQGTVISLGAPASAKPNSQTPLCTCVKTWSRHAY
ncbi:hypothetical protein LCGC14_2624110, partial [marine sediment metagenome]